MVFRRIAGWMEMLEIKVKINIKDKYQKLRRDKYNVMIYKGKVKI